MTRFRSLCCPAVLLAACMTLLPADCVGQNEPVVRLQTQTCQGGYCTIGNGNAVIIGNNGKSLLVLTVAHNVRDAQQVKIAVNGSWYPASIEHTNAQDDIATLQVNAALPDVPCASLAQADPTQDEQLEMRTYWPEGWKYRVRVAQRQRVNYRGAYSITRVSTQGCSGSPIFARGKVAGLVSGNGGDHTVIVSASTIHGQMLAWGYRPAYPNAPPQPPVEQREPIVRAPGGLPTSCDCQARFNAIERAVSQLSARIDSLQTGSDAGPEIAALSEQIKLLEYELEQLSPLKERRVILTSDGKVTSQRVLKPGDPLVLGSEIVVRKSDAD